jgi:alcohol dehydrogenase
MKTRAALLNRIGAPRPYAQSRPLEIVALELDRPGPQEILVRIEAAGLCHSDLSVINGDRPRPVPMALGHEAAGVVEEVGEGVNDLEPGDHVVLVFVPSCGHCPSCAAGRPALCEPGAAANGAGTLLSGARRLHRGPAPIHHHLGCSAFAEYVTVSRYSAVRVDPALSFEHAALFGCAVLTGVGSVINTAQVRLGSTVAIVGLGGVGLSAVLGARAAGAREVIALDLAPEKLEHARALGATQVLNAGEADVVEKVRSITGGGVDYALDMAGARSAFELAYRITSRGGTTVTAGLPPPDAAFALPLVNLVAEERTVKGSYIGTCVPARDLPRFVSLFRQGRLPVDQLLSGRLALGEINRGFDLLASGEAIRQVVLPHEA